VTVARVAPADFVETVLATGSLVAREEILVGPEVEGLRITEVLADEGMRVKKGEVLARARRRHAGCAAGPERCRARPCHGGHRPGRSSIVQAVSAPDREQKRVRAGQPLRDAGHMAESSYDQREQGRPHGASPARRRPGRAKGGRGREGAESRPSGAR